MTTTSAFQNNFNAAAGSYNICNGIQPDVARRLAEWMPVSLTDSANILEIGCGTGYLTELLWERYPRNPMWVTDLALAMVAAARHRVEARYGTRAATIWQAVDVRTFEPEVKFGLIASSLALHWIRPLPETLQRLAGLLVPGGQLVCSLMTKGTLAELHEMRRAVAPGKTAMVVALPDVKAVVSALHEAGLSVQALADRKTQTQMASAAELLRMLGAQGIAAGFYGSDSVLNRTELLRLMREYDRAYTTPGGGVCVTWHMLYLVAINP